jgi:hypothetical protein
MGLKHPWWFGACVALSVAQACGGSDEQTAMRAAAGDADGGESGNSLGGGSPGAGIAGTPSAGESAGGTANQLSQGGAGLGGAVSDAGAGALGGGPEAGASAAGAGGEAGAASCELGEVSSAGTNQNLNLFGTVVYFADGDALPAGRYRITFVDGCMKYSSAQDWTIHAYASAEPDGWWFVGDTTAQKIVVPPGTVGYAVANGAYATFDACVSANLALPPKEFDFAGGKLGVWLQDDNYGDNLAGVDDRNPKWKLTLLGACTP